MSSMTSLVVDILIRKKMYMILTVMKMNLYLQERDNLKKLSQKQAKTQMMQRSLPPSSRLLLDPLLARDLEEKLILKQRLEVEMRRLRQAYGREAAK